MLDLAYQVALTRPGVGVQGSSVSAFIERYRHGAEWDYDHPLERRALERGCCVIIWQEQVVQFITAVSGMSAADADHLRRAFSRKDGEALIARYAKRFTEENARPSAGRRQEDIRLVERALHVSRIPISCLRGDGVSSRIDKAILSRRVLRRAMEFARPNLPCDVLTCAAAEAAPETNRLERYVGQ